MNRNGPGIAARAVPFICRYDQAPGGVVGGVVVADGSMVVDGSDDGIVGVVDLSGVMVPLGAVVVVERLFDRIRFDLPRWVDGDDMVSVVVVVLVDDGSIGVVCIGAVCIGAVCIGVVWGVPIAPPGVAVCAIAGAAIMAAAAIGIR